ncbi:nucleoside deaminase [Streptomyces ferrugineus]|uniref:nucleoside deaminase n=1 Tax=Streptomyces ferrugineus TaxID=1413221 RepID=UPI001D13F615|nr:nucleoside deaminase [Streptomyces ferrugineus]
MAVRCGAREHRTGEVLGSGVNTGADNPVWHGEVVAMNDYVRRQGNQGWADTTLYTTGEPCSMCMSALAWANVRRVVWASSIDEIRRTGVVQIDLSAGEVASAARSFYSPELLLADDGQHRAARRCGHGHHQLRLCVGERLSRQLEEDLALCHVAATTALRRAGVAGRQGEGRAASLAVTAHGASAGGVTDFMGSKGRGGPVRPRSG